MSGTASGQECPRHGRQQCLRYEPRARSADFPVGRPKPVSFLISGKDLLDRDLTVDIPTQPGAAVIFCQRRLGRQSPETPGHWPLVTALPVYSGATDPRLIMVLMASATDISRRISCSSGT